MRGTNSGVMVSLDDIGSSKEGQHGWACVLWAYWQLQVSGVSWGQAGKRYLMLVNCRL